MVFRLQPDLTSSNSPFPTLFMYSVSFLAVALTTLNLAERAHSQGFASTREDATLLPSPFVFLSMSKAPTSTQAYTSDDRKKKKDYCFLVAVCPHRTLIRNV